MARHKNSDWNLPRGGNQDPLTWQHAEVAVLMDIRDELQRLNQLLHCPNFIAIPRKLDQIITQTKKRKYTRRTPR